MSDDQTAGEQDWARDKRDFVADWRDEIAAEREVAADARDATADLREKLQNERDSELDQREQRIDAHAAEQQTAPRGGSRAGVQRSDARAEREEKSTERGQKEADRAIAGAGRQEVSELRQSATRATGLAVAFAEIARYLFEADNFDDVLTRVVQTTISAVSSCEMASVTVRDGSRFRTLTSSHGAATEVDYAQYEANEGPCLDAVDEPVVYAPRFPDERWPVLAVAPARSGVQSIASYQLAVRGSTLSDAFAGSLNTYAATPKAFDDEALEIGFVLAAHAAVAARAISERETLEQVGRQLHEALSSRDVIGQAKGILMERLHLTPEDAFDALRHSSQQLNLKLREIAQTLAETGELADPDSQT